MKRTIRLALSVGIAWGCLTVLPGDASAITKEEVITLVRLGIPEADVIKAIEKDKTVFVLNIQDILELKKAGVPDGVIRYMLATGQAASPTGAATGAGEAPAPSAAQPAAETRPTAPVVREKTAEELQQEEEKRREEARRLAEEQRKAEEARKAAYARGVLRRGLDQAEKGQWVESIQTFQRFVTEGNFGPGSLEAYNAKYGMAAALTQAGLYQSAARLLVDVLLEGPDRPFFAEAFARLRKLRQEVIYNPPDLEELTRFPLGSFSQRFQDDFNYVLGEYFYDAANYQRALKHFEAISEESPDLPKALYLTALIQVRYKMFKSAVENLQKSIEIAERLKTGQDILDLAYMALARIAYESENFDAAIFYYKKVPRSSIRAGTVFYELAWTYLMKGDYSRAIGSFQILHSPVFGTTFYPELWILEARAFGDLCRYDRAYKALKRFDQDVAVHIEPLRRFLNAQRSPEDFFHSFVRAVNDPQGATVRLPAELQWPVLTNVEFYNLYRTIRQIEREDQMMRSHSSVLGTFAQEMLVKLAVLKKDTVIRAGVKIQQVLTEVQQSIADAQVQQTEIEVDINAADIDRMTREIRVSVGESEEEQGVQQSRSIAIVGEDTAVWPFEGEYWMDEIPYFRSMLTSQCTQQ